MNDVVKSNSDIDVLEDIKSKSWYIIDTLFDLNSSKYNQKLIDFIEGEIIYVLSTKLNIIECRVIKINEKDKNDNFSFFVTPNTDKYKIGIINKIKLKLCSKYNINFNFGFPWHEIPEKVTSGINGFKKYEEALNFLKLRFLYYNINSCIISTENILQDK